MDKTNLSSYYLQVAIKSFRGLKKLGEKTFAQLVAEDYFWKPNEEANSIAILMQHLSGNMLSRWTDFLTTDGEKPNRNRDSEFEDSLKDKEGLMAAWEKGWSCLFAALDQLSEEDLLKTVYIRSEPHSVIQAIERQVSHYSVHLGQIVLLAKLRKGEQWQTLSIPKRKV